MINTQRINVNILLVQIGIFPISNNEKYGWHKKHKSSQISTLRKAIPPSIPHLITSINERKPMDWDPLRKQYRQYGWNKKHKTSQNRHCYRAEPNSQVFSH